MTSHERQSSHRPPGRPHAVHAHADGAEPVTTNPAAYRERLRDALIYSIGGKPGALTQGPVFVEPVDLVRALNDLEALAADAALGWDHYRQEIEAGNVRRDQMEKMAKALAAAAAQFKFYAEQHRAKSPPDYAKAQTNDAMERTCLAALNPTPQETDRG